MNKPILLKLKLYLSNVNRFFYLDYILSRQLTEIEMDKIVDFTLDNDSLGTVESWIDEYLNQKGIIIKHNTQFKVMTI